MQPSLVRERFLTGPDHHPEGRDAWRAQLWRLLTAELWLRFQADSRLPERLSSQWQLVGPHADFRVVGPAESPAATPSAESYVSPP